MKKINIIKIVATLFLIQACDPSDCIELVGTDPIQETICDTGLLIIRSDGETGEPRFSFDSISKPIEMPLVFQNIRVDAQDDSQFDIFTRPSNYDAYNPITNEYVIEFPLQQRIYNYNIDTQSRQELIVAGFYSAPVFSNNILYAITIDNFGYATDPANYSIESINLSNGTLTSLVTSSFPLISSFNWESMSSVSDNNGTIYFVSGTNLVTYNISANMATHTELSPDFDQATNFQKFYGLEMRNNGNLLAIRTRIDTNGSTSELIEINVNNPTEDPIIVFDFIANGIELNPEFYSTTYDICDDTYYITSRNSNDFNTTDFYEIDLSASTIEVENFPDYLIGVESKNN